MEWDRREYCRGTKLEPNRKPKTVSFIFTFGAAGYTFTWPCNLPWTNRYQRLLFRSVSMTPLLCAGAGNHTCIQSRAKSTYAGEQCSKVITRGHISARIPHWGIVMLQNLWKTLSCSKKILSLSFKTGLSMRKWSCPAPANFLFIWGVLGEAIRHAPGYCCLPLDRMPSFFTQTHSILSKQALTPETEGHYDQGLA